MRRLSVQVIETAASTGQVHIRCAGGGPLPDCQPGQMFLARPEASEPFCLRQPLFPHLAAPDVSPGPASRPHGAPGRRPAMEFWVDPERPFAGLSPGARLDLVGPCGRGFRLGDGQPHLLAWTGAPARLMPVILHVLARGGSVALLLPPDAPLPDLPPEVEIQRGSLTPDLAAWADRIALDWPDPGPLARQARQLRPGRGPDFVQALITPPMPCGTGACLACWAETPRGRRLACVAGPVFEV